MIRQRSSEDRGENGSTRRRIVLVTPGFSASNEDWCIPILRDLAEGLAVRNDVSIVTLRYPGAERRYRVAGADVRSLGGGTRKGVRKIGLLVKAVAAITGEVRRRSADVIHAFWAHEPGAVASIAGRITGVPVVVTVMGGELAELPEIDYGGMLAPGNRMLTRFCLGRADRVVTLCRTVHKKAAIRVEAPRLCRLEFGVQTDRFSLVPKTLTSPTENQISFIAVGSLVPVKGHEVMLRAFARCHAGQPRTTLDLVGMGPLRSELEKQTQDLGIGSAVRFVGEVDQSELPECYRQADVLVLGSVWEGGAPQVVYEALACGLPIVGTAVGIVPELSDSALCVPVGDADALGREMTRIASNAELRSRLAAGAAAAVRSIGACVADHERLYDSIPRRSPTSHRNNRDG